LAARSIAVLAIASIFALPTASPASGATLSCGETITQDTTLTQNLVNCPGDGLVVGAPNITINLNGHRLGGTGNGYGISNFGAPPPPPCSKDDCWPTAGLPGLTVKNGTIAGFANALYAVGDHETFRGLHVKGTLAACCYGKNNSSAVPHDIKVLSSWVEGWIQAGADSVVQANQVVGGNLTAGSGSIVRNRVTGGSISIGTGTVSSNVVVPTASGTQGSIAGSRFGGSTVITGNVVGGGVYLPSPRDAQIDHNDITGGIQASALEAPPGSLNIADNRIQASSSDGIRIVGEWCATVSGNRIYGSPSNGIYVISNCVDYNGLCDGVTSITGNRIYDNALSGISTPNTKCAREFEDNSIWNNGADGIYVANNRGPITISGNSTRRNGGDGIHIDASTGQQSGYFWSPDGRKVVFQDNHGAGWDIYSANADGTGMTRLTSDPGDDTTPEWSPDGSTIAFVSQRDGSPGLYLMNADGSGVHKLTSLEFVQDPEEPMPVRAKTFVWSLDGQRILFGNDRLYSINVDGTDLHTLSEAHLVVQPRWTPDGSKIVFFAGPWFPTIEATTYIINADGTGLRKADPATDYPTGTVGGGENPTGQTLTPDVLTNPLVTLTGNSANDNKGQGIDAVPGVVDGGGNRVWHNG
jgi:hypothetical protein